MAIIQPCIQVEEKMKKIKLTCLNSHFLTSINCSKPNYDIQIKTDTGEEQYH